MFEPSSPRLPAHPTRRQVIQASLAAAATIPLLGPRITHGQQANETLNLAAVGVGGKGWSDLMPSSQGENVRVVALCDVDRTNLGNAASRFEDAATYTDYRVMLDEMGSDIDALLVSTPDHMHGPIAIAAMQLGIHVHVQKPLAHNIAELRTMMQLAESNNLVTQMGTQIHSDQAYRTGAAMIREGAIGKVKEAHLWVSRSWGGPPEGRADRTDPVPDHLDWDNWLGVAPHRPYVNGAYHPGNWRGWIDFGSGTLGDMGCHIFDPVFSAIDLQTPLSVVSRGPQHYRETFAVDSDISYQFAGTEFTTDELFFRWTDGNRGSRPDAAKAQLPDGVNLPGAGMFLVGEEGVMVLPHWAMPTFYKDGEPMDIAAESRGSNNHYTEFTDACRGVGETSTPFSYSGRVTEAVLVGTIAGRFKDRELAWDSENMRFDHDAATAVVYREYADGREPEGLVGREAQN
ncbi:MAG: Gfo/Idh/MocA family oxidoreductase [Planctomycetota bacterium]